ncbi:MAG: glycerol kinase GlpK [Acidimicrobiales bacterium]
MRASAPARRRRDRSLRGYGAAVAVVIAIDAGTTSVRSLAIDENCQVIATSQRELPQHFPAPGLVEHDAAEIWTLVEATLVELRGILAKSSLGVAAVGIANQRETAVAWDRSTGKPCCRAIVWQDRRTAQRCAELAEAGFLPLVRERTGLVLDPYFSGTKWSWMLEKGRLAPSGSLALGTVDDWVCWNLTGGVHGGLHVTDPSNASRTLCYDIGRRRWSAELCEMLKVPIDALGEVRPSAGRYATVCAEVAGGLLKGVPVSGIAGDQQAALFGHCCYLPGETKVTYGTGSFVLMNLGAQMPLPTEGLLTTIAWDLGDHAPPGATDGFSYALEGAIFSSGATIQWLRDGLAMIDQAAQLGPLASQITNNDGVFLVPAFAGLGSPWWDPEARGTICGITKGTGRAHLARAAVEAIAYQCRDVLEAMGRAAGQSPKILRADGGAAAMDLLLQLQADQCDLQVVRPESTEMTALGAAMLAGLAEGVWSSLGELRSIGAGTKVFEPGAGRGRADADHLAWLAALERSRHWEATPRELAGD